MSLNLIDTSPVRHKISILRDVRTNTKEFRELAGELAQILCYEALRDAPLKRYEVTSPICAADGYLLDENDYVFLPILRAGLGLVDGLLKFMPNARLGHIGLYRDETTLKPVKYYYKTPADISNKHVFILDPMLATAGSALAAIEILREQGVQQLSMICLFAAPEGVRKLEENYPDVTIYAASLDERLNENGYIVPGCGDAGDRLWGTK
ncbi:MAG: uracil phosphoribosyltransferase [Oscillospiraceae bacterium]|jgi:uracil phosphoribosyltransferase|nr:uracil phosphoribosyltransferase [Oscillospiraceae bacterium]